VPSFQRRAMHQLRMSARLAASPEPTRSDQKSYALTRNFKSQYRHRHDVGILGSPHDAHSPANALIEASESQIEMTMNSALPS